jgi:hypothetical protein
MCRLRCSTPMHCCASSTNQWRQRRAIAIFAGRSLDPVEIDHDWRRCAAAHQLVAEPLAIDVLWRPAETRTARRRIVSRPTRSECVARSAAAPQWSRVSVQMCNAVDRCVEACGERAPELLHALVGAHTQKAESDRSRLRAVTNANHVDLIRALPLAKRAANHTASVSKSRKSIDWSMMALKRRTRCRSHFQ